MEILIEVTPQEADEILVLMEQKDNLEITEQEFWDKVESKLDNALPVRPRPRDTVRFLLKTKTYSLPSRRSN